MKYWIDEKVTIWRRNYYETKEDMEIDIENIKNNDGLQQFCDTELLHETEQLMTVEENDNNSVFEAYNDGLYIWGNGI